MKRRDFLTKAGLGTVATGASLLSAQAQAQQGGSLPAVTWRMATSWTRNLDILYGGCERISKRVAAATGGKFTIRVFAAGEIVPGLQVLDAVQNGTIECGHTAGYYYYGKDPAFAIAAAIPFGMNARQQNAWMYHGGGMELIREFYRDYNFVHFPAGNTGTQMGGWFRKEIRSLADLKGLKFRIGGFAGAVLQRLGVVPQQIAGGDIYPALEKGTIDAAEWVGPYDDEKLGFAKVARYYYYPGWWEGSAQLDLLINVKAWEALPAEYKAVLEAACYEASMDILAHYDAANPPALKRLVASGVRLMPFSNEVMAACYKTAHELYEETSAKNPKFKKIYTAWKQFRDTEVQWFSVAENRFDNFMLAAERITQQRGPAKK
jgi:TRAP-type mannitol/chloroaromatic compound transport system substrate-binding protein